MDDDEIEIDLHEIVLTLWRRRWTILAVPFVIALVALILSAWVLPKQYQAAAYISLNMPLINYNKTAQGVTTNQTSPDNTTGRQESLPQSVVITINQTLPDIKILTELATSPSLLKNVLADPAIVVTGEAKPISVADLGDMIDTSVVGQNMLRLQVTDTDPQRAALLSNSLAAQVTANINDTYGLNAIAQSIKAQVTLAQQDYQQAQTALENELYGNSVDAFNAQLANEIDDLNCVLNKTSATTRVLNDLQVLKQRLEAVPADGGLSLGDALALTTLQQRALSSQVCVASTQSMQVQINGDTLSGLTQAKALESITQIQGALQTWQATATTQQTQLEQHIPQLQKDLETAKDQLHQLTAARDHAQSLYEALIQLQKQTSVSLTESNQIARLSIQAGAPEKKSTPKVLQNTALAGAAGLVLAVLWVFLQDWWQKDKREENREPA
jgi:capsular polysaccharide biosynthesis protein